MLLASVLLLLSGGTDGMGQDMPDITVTLSPEANNLSFIAPHKLALIGQNVVEKHFQDDMRNSRSVRCEVKVIRKTVKNADCILQCLFLYRETYTAKTHRAVFTVSEHQYAIQSIDDRPAENLPNKQSQ